ncbi:hypothetical protein DXB59_14690 [Ruminococcus sp. OM05-10BH]|nr:hypothetical protein DXB59_14690 [Ruminococcus sp. OM05-10BH]
MAKKIFVSQSFEERGCFIMEREPYTPVTAEAVLHADPENGGQLFQWVCEKLEQEGNPVTSEKGDGKL